MAGLKRGSCLRSTSCPKSRSIWWLLKCRLPDRAWLSQKASVLLPGDTVTPMGMICMSSGGRKEGRELCLPLCQFLLQFILHTSARYIFQDTKSCYMISCLKVPMGFPPAPYAYRMLPKPQKTSPLPRLLTLTAWNIFHPWKSPHTPLPDICHLLPWILPSSCWCVLTPQLRCRFLRKPSSALSESQSLSFGPS